MCMVKYLWNYLIRDSLSVVTNFGHCLAFEVVKVTVMVAVSGRHSYVHVYFAALDLLMNTRCLPYILTFYNYEGLNRGVAFTANG